APAKSLLARSASSDATSGPGDRRAWGRTARAKWAGTAASMRPSLASRPVALVGAAAGVGRQDGSARPGHLPDGPADLGPQRQGGLVLSHPDEAAEELHVEVTPEVFPDERRPRQAAREVARRRAAQVEPFPVPLPGQEQPQLLPALRQPGV